MIFMLLFHSDERVRTSMSDAEYLARIEETHFEYHMTVLREHADVILGYALEPTTESVTVRPSGGEMTAMPGPPAETRETFAGFYLIDCADMEEAVELARRYPMPEGLGCCEVRPISPTWDHQPYDTPAAPETIWRLYRDVAGWPRWMHEIERAELSGPFGAGATGWITPAGHRPMPLRIVEADENQGYVSETGLSGDMVLRMEHTLRPGRHGGTRILHRATLPPEALKVFGLAFGPRFNFGMRRTLINLSELAREREADGRRSAAATAT